MILSLYIPIRARIVSIIAMTENQDILIHIIPLREKFLYDYIYNIVYTL